MVERKNKWLLISTVECLVYNLQVCHDHPLVYDCNSRRRCSSYIRYTNQLFWVSIGNDEFVSPSRVCGIFNTFE